MTEEVKKLIESVKIWRYPIPLSFQSRPMELVEKSDFDRVVEELTKWNKVEDRLPEIGTLVLIKHSNGDLHVSQYDGQGFIDMDFTGLWCNVIEWSYIY